jgi:hypothetical protein
VNDFFFIVLEYFSHYLIVYFGKTIYVNLWSPLTHDALHKSVIYLLLQHIKVLSNVFLTVFFQKSFLIRIQKFGILIVNIMKFLTFPKNIFVWYRINPGFLLFGIFEFIYSQDLCFVYMKIILSQIFLFDFFLFLLSRDAENNDGLIHLSSHK